MLKKSLLLMLLMALLVPWAANAQEPVPYNEGFESMSSASDLTDAGWIYYFESSSSFVGISTSQYSEGSKSLQMDNWNAADNKYQVVGLPVLEKAINTLQITVSFNIATNGTFSVGYLTSATDANTFVEIESWTNSGWQTKTVDLSSAPDGAARIAFKYYRYWRCYVDDIKVKKLPTCIQPKNLKATLTPGNGTIATLNWNAGGSETAWVLEYGTTSDFTGATSVNVSGTPTKNIKDLTAETKYYARVKADCGGGDTSEWSATCEFTPTDQLIISILGTTGSTAYYLPSNTNYDYAYTQQIYTAEEMGGFACTLQSVAFKGNKASVCNLDIYLANTDKSSFTSTSDYIAISEATLVFSGNVTFIADDWKTIEFDNEFDYTGGNLAVIVDDNSGNYDYYTTTWQTFNTTTAQALYFYQDDTNINPSSPSAGYSGNPSVKNQIKFVYDLPSPYVKPQNLAVTNLGATSATITWEAPSTEVLSYKYQYREAGGAWSALTSTTALSAPLTVLTGNTTYEFQVQAIYAGNNESAFASTSFTTPCAAFPIDYEYGFEDESEFNCWEIANDQGRMHLYSNDDVNDAFGSTGIQYSRTGDNLFFFTYYDYPTTNPEYQTIISPELTGITNGLHVEFYYTTAGSYGPETFAVGYSTTNKQLSSFTWGNEVTSGETDYQLFKANYPAETKYIAFQQRSDDKNWIMIDDFSFTEAPDCVEPSNIQTPNITTTGANLSWTVGGSESAWDIYVTDDVTDVPDELTTPTYASVTYHTNYPISGLTSGTTYYVYLRSACDKTTHSDWTMPYQFNTECETIPLPYSYDFEDDALPICYNTISSDAGWNIFYISDGDPQHGSKHLIMSCQSSNEYQLLVLPEVDANYPLDEYEITFYAKLAAGSGRTLAVGIMTDPDDESTFEQIGDEITPTTTYAQYKVKFNNYTGSGQYIAILHYISNTGNTYIDNIEVNHLPACIEPDDFEVTVPTAHGATFAWTSNGSETEWHLYFGKNNTAPADDIDLGKVTVADSNPFTMTTGLDSETDYYVWVRANCGSTDGYSSWVGPETFTTEPACFVPTGLAASEVTGHTAKLSWTGTSESYVLSVGTYDYTGTPVLGTIIEEGFEHSGSWPEGWTSIDEDGSGKGWYINSTYNTGSYGAAAQYNSSAVPSDWLISPQIQFGGGSISFYAKKSSGTEQFQVYVSTTGKEISDFTAISEVENATTTFTKYEYDLSSYSGSGYVAIKHTGAIDQYWLYLDDITITGPTYPIAWTDYAITTTSKTVEGLDPETQYFAKVKGYCGTDDGYSQETAVISFTTDIACPAPTGLTASNPKSNSFDLQWTNGGSEDWVLAYKVDGAADFTEVDLNVSDVTEEAGTISYTLSGLDPETDYIVKVRDNCEPSYTGDGVSEWTAEVPFSTIAACSAMNPVVDQASITHHTATVNWEGESATGFTVNYRTAESPQSIFFEGFETYANEAALETVWTVIDLGDGANTSELGLYSGAAKTDDYGFRFSSYNKASTTSSPYTSDDFDQYLISPELTVNGVLGFAYKSSNGTTDVFRVGYSSTTNDLSAFTWGDEINSASSWQDFSETMPAGTKYFAINYTALYKFRLFIDDINIYETNPAGAWQTQAATGTTADLTSLTSGTLYDVKVVPNCDETLESATVQFTTLAGDIKYFLTAGEWETAANWMDDEIPTSTDDAIIRANVTITNYAEAKNVTLQGTSKITIADGAQFIHNNAVNATLQRDITGYGNDPNVADGWYLIATPVSSTYITTNFSGTFDLYKYNEPDYMWYTWNSTTSQSFNYLYRNTGYLYAHDTNTQLSFTGEMMGTKATTSKSLSYTSSLSPAHDDVIGFNLIGNPFTRNLVDGDMTIGGGPLTSYYVINPDGDALVQVNSDAYQIKPGEGFFVQAGGSGQSVEFNPSSKDAFNVAYIKIVAGNEDGYDNACIQIEEGNTLRKMNIAKKTSVYVIDNGDDYAAATIHELAGTMPVHFNAIADGEFTITVNAKNIEPSTMMLYDNQTGELIDLLETPSYSFKASAEDEDNRFKLIFDFNNNYNGVEDNFTSEIFVYQSGDELIVNGEGELQIFDVLGRLVTSKNISGVERISKPAQTGVYIFRLNEHTQKIVIK